LSDRDPLATLGAEWPWIKVYVRRMDDKFGQTIWTGPNGQPYIEIAGDIGPIQQRVTLAHEMHHLVAGAPCTSFCGQNEREVVKATAEWLLPDLDELGAILRDHDMASAARELRVTTDVIADRLAGLSESDTARLTTLLSPATDGPVTARVGHGPRRPIDPEHRCKLRRSRTPQPPSLGQDQDARP
jgi:hypothetical protein